MGKHIEQLLLIFLLWKEVKWEKWTLELLQWFIKDYKEPEEIQEKYVKMECIEILNIKEY